MKHIVKLDVNEMNIFDTSDLIYNCQLYIKLLTDTFDVPWLSNEIMALSLITEMGRNVVAWHDIFW